MGVVGVVEVVEVVEVVSVLEVLVVSILLNYPPCPLKSYVWNLKPET